MLCSCLDLIFACPPLWSLAFEHRNPSAGRGRHWVEQTAVSSQTGCQRVGRRCLRHFVRARSIDKIRVSNSVLYQRAIIERRPVPVCRCALLPSIHRERSTGTVCVRLYVDKSLPASAYPAQCTEYASECTSTYRRPYAPVDNLLATASPSITWSVRRVIFRHSSVAHSAAYTAVDMCFKNLKT